MKVCHRPGTRRSAFCPAAAHAPPPATPPYQSQCREIPVASHSPPGSGRNIV